MPTDVFVSWVISVAVPFLLEYFKGQEWARFMQPYRPTLNRVTAVVAAVVTGLGVSWSYDAYTGRLVVDGLILADALKLAGQIVGNWIIQEVTYRKVIHQ